MSHLYKQFFGEVPMPMIKGQAVSDQMMLDEVRTRMGCKGFRPVQEYDLRPGRELVMVEVERYYLAGKGLPPIGMAGTTVVRLDDEPIKPSNDGSGKQVVFYHCVDPQWDGDCFSGKETFLLDQYVSPMDSDTRYFAKR